MSSSRLKSKMRQGGAVARRRRRRSATIGEKIGLYKDWPVSKGCGPPYVPVAVKAMVKPKE